MRLFLSTPKDWDITIGESINIDGVCSTVEKVGKLEFSVYYMPETLRRTILSEITPKHLFNLEKCLTLQTLIGGHLVTGHIDTTAQVLQITNEQDARIIQFGLNPEFTKYIIYKGSIAVNGVSLTIVAVDKNSFTVSLIPYTLEHTNLGTLNTGNTVNIEVDMIAKYLEKLKK